MNTMTKMLKIDNFYIMSIISKLIIVLLTFVTSIIINRYLQPGLKGEYSYILNWVAIAALILNLGIGQSVSFFRRRYGESIINSFINIYYLQLVVYFIIILIINYFYTDKTLNLILVISALTQFNSQLSFLSIIKNINRRNVIAVITTIIYLIILAIIFVSSSENLDLIIAAYMFKISIDSIIMIAKNKFYPKFEKIDFRLVQSIIKFGFFPMITSLLITFNYNLDIIILKSFVEYDKIGLYSVGVTLAGMLWILPDAFKDVLFSKTSTSDAISDIQFSIKFNIYFCLIIIFVFFIFGQPFIKLIYGSEYVSSYMVAILLMTGGIPMIYFKMINTLYISIGKQKFTFIVLLAAVFLNVILNYLLIPKYSINGAAIASLASYSVSGLIFLISFTKNYDLSLKSIIFFSELDRQNLYRVLGRKMKKL